MDLDVAEELRLIKQIEAGVLAGAAIEARDFSLGSEAELAELVALGRESQSELVAAHTRLVYWLMSIDGASRYIPESELYSEGVLGLVDAIWRFDYRKGNRFATYAVPWVKFRLKKLAKSYCRNKEVPVSELWQGQETSEDIANSERQLVAEGLSHLPKPVGLLLRRRFGIDCDAHTYQKLGELYGVSQSKAADMTKQALAQLKHYLEAA